MRRPKMLASPASESQLQPAQQMGHHVQPASLRGSPSLWSRLGRKVSQRRASGSSVMPMNEPHAVAGEHGESPSPVAQPARSEDTRDSESCGYCGHTRMIEFAVAQKHDTKGNQSPTVPPPPSNLLVCESCKRVKNMI
ncbi:hypothetical protein LPJ73_003082 [Coemansia sp. RSA 2703]|nr:hypothetical protein LPJ73_003082 [Coemansia sp. RSA 2703]